MIIECPHCRSRVDAKEHGSHSEPQDPDDWDVPEERVVVGECSICNSPLVGLQREYEHPDYGTYWSNAERLWPYPRKTIARSVPDIVKVSLEEADTCFHAGAFVACAVMSMGTIYGDVLR